MYQEGNAMYQTSRHSRLHKQIMHAADLNTLCPSVCLLLTPNEPQLQTNVWMTAQIRGLSLR